MFIINAQLRKNHGKSASRRLRIENKFPAILYGGKELPVAIILDEYSVKNIESKAEFYSETMMLVINGKETIVKVQAIQRHPFKSQLTHIDFLRK
ncbi:50S ribosomal protein L25 [Candidatus Gillettellia adelgis]